jgi:hypothetical protein
MSLQLNNIAQSFIVFAVFVFSGVVLFPEVIFAADFNAALNDVSTKTDSVMNWAISSFCYFIAVISFIAWCIGMLLRKLSWDVGITILVIIILMGFAPTIVGALMNKS